MYIKSGDWHSAYICPSIQHGYMNKKTTALIGLLAPCLFVVTYSIMTNLRPEYDLRYKAISELGSLDAPHKWAWNIVGYIIPGILIALFAVGLQRAMPQGYTRRLPMYGLLLSGALMALAGIFPADMDNRRSATMLLHVVGSWGSFIGFLVAAFSYPRQWKKDPYWQKISRPSLVLVWLAIVWGAWPFVFPQMPALGQRFVFLFYYSWILLLAYRLYRSQKGQRPD
jgi:hypothetical membrane protein